MEKANIKEFINQYADAVAKVDIEKIASRFHDTFSLSTQKDYWHIQNNDEFKLSLEKAFKGYKKIGASFFKLVKYNIIDFQSNHCVVNIEWGLFNSDSNLIVKFDISYCIKEINGNFKYVFLINHNEIENIEAYLKGI